MGNIVSGYDYITSLTDKSVYGKYTNYYKFCSGIFAYINLVTIENLPE